MALSLGQLISALEQMPKDAPLRVMGVGISGVDSYRGYYEDLAIEPGGQPETVAAGIKTLRAADGATFTGYKGGTYKMTSRTAVWVSHYGEASDERVVDAVLSGTTGEVSILTETQRW